MLSSLKLAGLTTSTSPFSSCLCKKEEGNRWCLFKCKTGGTKAQSSGVQSWIRIAVLSFDRVLGDAEGEQ